MNKDGTLSEKDIVANLFYAYSPIKIYPTYYLWVKKSFDNGETFTDGRILNLEIKSKGFTGFAPGTGISIDYNGKNRKASAHYFVDSDSITQSVPDNYVAWSVGGAKYKGAGGRLHNKCTNNNSISIELCDDVKNGVVYPSAKTIQNALELTALLMKKYNIPKENVIRHYDVTGKHCPAYWVDDKKWKSEFWNTINKYAACFM